MRWQAGTDEERMHEAMAAVRARIEAACARAGRSPEEVTVVAAAKGVGIQVVRLGLGAGITDFGENYVRGLVDKAPMVPARWHFFGKLQAGTAAKVARHADVVHSVEPGHALEKVARRAAEERRRIVGLVQVDFTGRRQGVEPGDVEACVRAASGLEAIQLAGLMTLPPFTEDPEGARPYFVRLREIRDRLWKRHPALRELSMGMSGDYEVAVEEGATMLRIGTALFGPRPANTSGTGGQGAPPG